APSVRKAALPDAAVRTSFQGPPGGGPFTGSRGRFFTSGTAEVAGQRLAEKVKLRHICRNSLIMPVEVLDIESLDLEARGIAHREGKVVFVEGALPGERVEATVVRRKPSYEKARTTRVLRESSQRVTPRCPHFGVCGGCAMQHLDARAQVAVKQRVLEDAFG